MSPTLLSMLLACAPAPSGADLDATSAGAHDPIVADLLALDGQASDWREQRWVEAQTFPADAGLWWDFDEELFIEDFSVPTILVLPEGYLMLGSDMQDDLAHWGTTAALWSEDGLTWETERHVLLEAGDFGADCGQWIVDQGVAYLDDGHLRLVVECGDGEGNRFLSATSADGWEWEPEGPLYDGTEHDHQSVSVPELLRVDDDRWVLWYIGDHTVQDEADGDTIRLADSADGASFSPLVEEGVLPTNNTDPAPVRLDDGGVRLYHTRTAQLGIIQASTASGDFREYTVDETFWGLDPRQHYGFTEEKWLDPAPLRLPDGRLVLYFTRIHRDDETGEVHSVGVGRAFASDVD